MGNECMYVSGFGCGPRTVVMRLKLGFTHCVQALLYGYDYLPFTLWVLAIVLSCVSPGHGTFYVLLRVGRWRRLRISVARRFTNWRLVFCLLFCSCSSFVFSHCLHVARLGFCLILPTRSVRRSISSIFVSTK